MPNPIYLDYMSTTPIDPRVAEKMIPYLSGDLFGNPASTHYYGYKAKAAVENARTQIADLINTEPENIIWTSSATEANNLAIKGAADFYSRQGKHIVTCKTEHSSVIDSCKYLETLGFEITYLTPKPSGLLDMEQLEKSLRQDTILVSIMHVNNEIGVIQNIQAIGELTRARGILFHVDAAQSAGKIAIDVKKFKTDLVSFSSHKIYGPKGVGALYIRSQPKLQLTPQIHGGAQENHLRAGTLATHQIVGMGEAFQIAALEMATEPKRLLALREKLWQGITGLGDIYINGSTSDRIPGNLNLSFANIDGELLLAALKDLAISSASACSSTNSDSSHVLQAIGVDSSLITNSVRFSIGRFTTEQEIEIAIKHINEVVKKLRSY